MSRDTPRDAQNVSGVAIDAEPAGFFRRTAALAYDLLLLAGILLVFTLITFVLRGAREIPPGTLWFQVSLLALVGAFFAGFWVHGGQTLGMRAWRLRAWCLRAWCLRACPAGYRR